MIPDPYPVEFSELFCRQERALNKTRSVKQADTLAPEKEMENG